MHGKPNAETGETVFRTGHTVRLISRWPWYIDRLLNQIATRSHILCRRYRSGLGFLQSGYPYIWWGMMWAKKNSLWKAIISSLWISTKDQRTPNSGLSTSQKSRNGTLSEYQVVVGSMWGIDGNTQVHGNMYLCFSRCFFITTAQRACKRHERAWFLTSAIRSHMLLYVLCLIDRQQQPPASMDSCRV